jgi:diaminopimelate epimerase
MHGLGNDFIIVNNDQVDHIKNITHFIQSASDRRLGIGCDQFIIYKLKLPNFCEMIIYNSDGTIAEACGNGTRCLAALIYEKHSIDRLEIQTQTRVIKSFISGQNVSVNMGQVSFEEPWMPSRKDLFDLLNLFDISIKEIQCVDIGNPHLVIFAKNFNDSDRKILIEKIYSSHLFKDGVNISFAKIENDIIDLYVWERGVGYSFACGTAACASFAAANKLGFIKDEISIKFELGSLKLHYENIMTGSATKTISGDYYYESK